VTKLAIEFGAKMTIMDAIEKGYTNKKKLIEFMKSKLYQESVIHYAEMFESKFSNSTQS
jgi:hypothetical protein